MTDVTNSAVSMLIAERDRIDQAIRLLQGGASAAPARTAPKRKGRPPLTEEARKAQSEKMKAYWADRKKSEKDKAAKKAAK
ncbi:MAG: hypothetical protein GC160_02690 [Acidobacteria bacterium]|nr:hypothetical protein [Acidobacteriota bacterium]